VTSIVCSNDSEENKGPQVLVSGSRDNSIIIWKLNPETEDEEA
jgi:hypothetical protein